MSTRRSALIQICAIVAVLFLSACRADKAEVAISDKLKKGISSTQTEDMYAITYDKVSYVADPDSAYVEITSRGMILRDYGDHYTSARELYDVFYKPAFNTRGAVTVFRRPPGVADVINWACFDCTQFSLK